MSDAKYPLPPKPCLGSGFSVLPWREEAGEDSGEMRWQKIKEAEKAGTTDPKDGVWGGVDRERGDKFCKVTRWRKLRSPLWGPGLS